MQLAPSDARAAATRAVALAAADRLTPALEEARRATALDPRSVEANVALGIVLRLRQDTQGALAACRRAADIAPNDSRVLTALGEALREVLIVLTEGSSRTSASRPASTLPVASSESGQVERPSSPAERTG